MSARIEKPMPAAISVRKLAQNSHLSLELVMRRGLRPRGRLPRAPGLCNEGPASHLGRGCVRPWMGLSYHLRPGLSNGCGAKSRRFSLPPPARPDYHTPIPGTLPDPLAAEDRHGPVDPLSRLSGR